AEEKVLNDAFPQNNHVLAIVITGKTAEIADSFALKLADALRKDPATFDAVTDPAGSEFLRRNVLLFSSVDEVQAVADQMFGAQGLLRPLPADPSLNGLFTALNLALEGVKRGQTDMNAIAKPLEAIDHVLSDTVSGRPAFLSWRTMLTGQEPNPLELHRVIT